MRGITITDLWKNPKRHGQGRRWMARVRDPLTKRYGHARSFDTKDAADEWARRELDGYLRGQKRATSATWKDVGDSVVVEARLNGKTEAYCRSLERVVNELHAFGARDINSDDFKMIVQRFLADRGARWGKGVRKGKVGGKGTTSLNHRHRILNRVRFIVNTIVPRLVPHSPLAKVRLPALPEKEKEHYRLFEIRRLIDRQRGRPIKPGVFKAKVIGDWWMFAVLAIYTYQRPTIVRNLKLDWFDFSSNTLFIPPECPGNKTKVAIRVAIQPELKEILLEEMLAGRIRRTGALVGDIMQRKSVSALTVGFRFYCKRCGVRPIGAHRVRHSAASMLVASGVSGFQVMDLLGHSNADQTKDYTKGANAYASEDPAILEWRGVFRLRNQASTSAGSTKTPDLPPRLLSIS